MRDYLTDGHIILRKFRHSDAAGLHEAVHESEPELTSRGFFHVGFSLEDAKENVKSRIQNWNSGRAYTYAIEEASSAIFLGHCRIAEFEPEIRHAGLGWWIRTSRTRQGIATAAGRQVAQAAFEDLDFISLVIYTNANNIASRRVAEKIGAVVELIKPEEDGQYCAVYKLMPGELRLGMSKLGPAT